MPPCLSGLLAAGIRPPLCPGQVDGGQDASMAIEPMVGGILIGMTTMMCFLSLMTAIYWGEMSG